MGRRFWERYNRGNLISLFRYTSSKTFHLCVYVFAGIGFVLVSGFFAVRLHLTDVPGIVDANSDAYNQKVLGSETEKALPQNDLLATADNENITDDNVSLSDINDQIEKLSKTKIIKAKNLCSIDVIGKTAPINAQKILETLLKTKNDAIASKMVFAAQLRLKNISKADEISEKCDGINGNFSSDVDKLVEKYQNASGQNIFPWMNNAEWETISEAIAKDKEAIDKAGQVAGVEPRLIVASAIVEQLRLFNSQRELFKKFFQPLKILGNANKISLGIMGIKEATAVQIENNLQDQSSPYYLGKELENVIIYANQADKGEQRFNRLTDESNNHYYSYLYGALYIKQMMNQWKNAGYDITYRPEIVGTLFNVGFPQSKPNANPKVGGSAINVGDAKYSFGSLSYEFYYSGELLEEFPYIVQ